MLYFDNLSADTGDAYLADGLTEAIIVRLSQVERLAVKSRNAVQRFRGRSADDPTTLGRALGISYLVNGSVRRAGTRVRLTVNLVRASSGLQLWGEQYDRESADVLAIEEDVARAVATAIAGRLLPGERASLAARPTRDPQAYDHFLRGNYYLARRNARAVARAIEEYEAAARLDPEFTKALAKIGLAYALFLDWGWEYSRVSADSLLDLGLAAGERALRLDSNDSDAWVATGKVLSHRNPHSYRGVREAFERAIALDAGNAEAHHQYGAALRELGDDSGSAAAYLRAIALEPDRAISLHGLGRTYHVQRRYRDAHRWLDSALAVDPGFYLAYARRALVRLFLGRAEEARDDAESAVRFGAGDPFGQAILALVDMRLGDTVMARASVARLVGKLADPDRLSVWDGSQLGMALLAIGDHAQALNLLERVQPRGVQLWEALRMPEFDPLRSHPRFQRLVEESRPPGAPR